MICPLSTNCVKNVEKKEGITMNQQETFETICKLFNDGILKIQDAINFSINNYALNCKAGKVLTLEKGSEK